MERKKKQSNSLYAAWPIKLNTNKAENFLNTKKKKNTYSESWMLHTHFQPSSTEEPYNLDSFMEGPKISVSNSVSDQMWAN